MQFGTDPHRCSAEPQLPDLLKQGIRLQIKGMDRQPSRLLH